MVIYVRLVPTAGTTLVPWKAIYTGTISHFQYTAFYISALHPVQLALSPTRISTTINEANDEGGGVRESHSIVVQDER